MLLAGSLLNATSANDIKVVKAESRPASGQPTEIKAHDIIDTGQYECRYRYDVKATTKNGDTIPETYMTILQIGYSSAASDVYKRQLKAIPDTPAETLKDFTDARNGAEFFFYGEVFQNYPSGKVTYIDIITPNTVQYEESLAPFEWELTEDTDTISSYPCMKATCIYGGRKWDAWFTEEIPVSAGPWKFAGLPGLILKVADDKGIHSFTMTSFKSSDTPILKEKNVNIQTTSRDKFVKVKNDFEKEPYKSVAPETITEVSVMNGCVWINGVRMPKRKNGYTPIELE